jgi:Transmembrane domain of unknown function (DUF3566)
MSDRTPSSVRTGTPSGDASAPAETPEGEQKPVSATQTIPGANTPRSSGVPTGSSPAVQPTGAPPVPPATGPGAAAPPATGGTPAQAGFPGATAGQATDTSGSSRGRGRGQAKSRGPRRARLQLRHIDTWSALKISLVLSIALFFIWMVAVGILYGVLSGLGVFNTVNDLFGQIGSASGSKSSGDVVTFGVVFWGAAVIGAINIVLMTALCTVGTFIYNLCSDLVGGLELTLSERD